MAINGFNKLGKAVDSEGKVHYQYAFKAVTPGTGNTNWFVDLNQVAGIPKYNAFAGSQLAFTPLVGSGNAGLYTGPFIPGKTKHLLRWNYTNTITSNNTGTDQLYLNDYLGFYPLIDCDDLTEQVCDNSSSLPRYSSGEGVRIVLITQAPMAATAPLTILYTNSKGVSGRSVTFNVLPGFSIGACATGAGVGLGGSGQVTPFFPLAEGDTGVRSIESFTFGSSAGGFICAALVKPLATLQAYVPQVTTEKMFGIENQMVPEILEGAYLNFLIKKASNQTAGMMQSELIFINS